jgi:hypothetical protein
MAVAAVLGAALFVGCGESRHDNEQRPNVATRVSVTISSKELIVQPTKVGLEAEKTQEIPQNEDDPEPPIKTRKPLELTIVAANQTATDTELKITGSGKEAESDTVFAHSPGTFGFELPAGSYTISAVEMPEARPAHLTVGSYRASSQNDVLLP